VRGVCGARLCELHVCRYVAIGTTTLWLFAACPSRRCWCRAATAVTASLCLITFYPTASNADGVASARPVRSRRACVPAGNSVPRLHLARGKGLPGQTWPTVECAGTETAEKGRCFFIALENRVELQGRARPDL
jgi:hypothetical protein